MALWPSSNFKSLSSWIKMMFICAAFKSHMEWTNVYVSILTTMILPTTAGTLNSFGHVIYSPQTNMYQSILAIIVFISQLVIRESFLMRLLSLMLWPLGYFSNNRKGLTWHLLSKHHWESNLWLYVEGLWIANSLCERWGIGLVV